MINEAILVYDIQSLPYGMDIEQMNYVYKEHNLVLYDGRTRRTDCIPRVYGEGKIELKMIDTQLLKKGELEDVIKKLLDKKESDLDEKVIKEFNVEYCNYNGKVVNKYVYYVREILGKSKEEYPLTNEWLEDFKKLDDTLYFPTLSTAQIVQLMQEKGLKP